VCAFTHASGHDFRVAERKKFGKEESPAQLPIFQASPSALIKIKAATGLFYAERLTKIGGS